jgi:rhamnosyltransferase
LEQHFFGFGESSNCIRMQDPERYRQDIGYRQYLHFFSSNNACIRRSIWQKIPLPDVDFAEDQLWARAVIEAGYAKAYAIDACVYHSHEFGVLESYRRAFDESRSFKRHFDYDLAPSLKHVGVHLRLLTKRDWRWIADSNVPVTAKLVRLCRAPFLNLAKLLGHYTGNKQKALPAWLSMYFSRDKALQKS